MGQGQLCGHPFLRPGRVEFALFAPGKGRVSVIGDFNGWDAAASPLECGDDGTWRAGVELGEGDYEYLYEVDGTAVTDPYAPRIAPQADGPDHGVLRVSAGGFEWKHTSYRRPPFKSLVLYEMHVGDFTPEGTFASAAGRLDHLRDLGINALLLMPVMDTSPEDWWGYRPRHFFAPRVSYGPAEELMRLVDEAHGQGIAVLLDVVPAHTSTDHTFNRLYAREDSPWYGASLAGLEHDFHLPPLGYDKGPTQRYVWDFMQFWMREYRVDGYRIDYAKFISSRDGMGLPHLVSAARAVADDAYLIAEHIPEAPGITNGIRLSGVWHKSLEDMLRAIALEREVLGCSWDAIASCAAHRLDPEAQGYESGTQFVNYVESHDEHRFLHEVGDNGFAPDACLNKLRLAALIAFTAPGQPMLYHGQEWGEDAPLTLEANKLHWERLDTPQGQELLRFYRQLITMVHRHGALEANLFTADAVDDDAKTLVYHCWNNTGDVLVVAANFSPQPRRLRIPLPASGRWHVVPTDEFLHADKQIERDLAPYEALVLASSCPGQEGEA